MKRLLAALAALGTLDAQTSVHAQGPSPQPPTSSLVPANIPKLTPEQTAAIMKQLEALESQVGKNRGDILGGALARFSKTLAAGEKGALELFLDCYKIEHFDRQDLKVTDFQDWRKQNEERHKDPEYLRGLWLQLQYLVFSLQAQDAKEKESAGLVAALQTYIPTMVAAIQSATKHTASGAVKESDKGAKGPPARRGGGGGRNFDSGGLQAMLRESVKQSEFAKAFQIDEFLKRADWCYEPFEIGNIFERFIFPYYLENKPAELPAQWDARIKAELSVRAAVMSESDYALYYKERYPGLLWRKADYLVSHNVNTLYAMADMLKLIQANPNHADASDWLKRLRALVNAAQPPGPPSDLNGIGASLPPTPSK